MRGTAGHETTTTTETKHGVFSTVTAETHKEGILSGAAGVTGKGVEVGASATAIEHGKSWTGKITLGKLTINLPGLSLSWGIGAGAKAGITKGSDGRLGVEATAKVGESLSLRYVPLSFSWNSQGAH
jgi:hypothetical protein